MRTVRSWRDRLPPGVRKRLRRARSPVFWGNLRRQRPFSSNFGFSRGTPVDRCYLERFLDTHRAAVRGVVGEVAGRTYADRFGGSEVHRTEVIDLVPGAGTTVVADIGVGGSLPEAAFDCLIVTQVLQYVPDAAQALRNLVLALRPGGSLLLAVPALAPHDPREPDDADFWRFWPAGLGRLLEDAAPRGECSVTAYGNLTAATAFLHGLAAEELTAAELDAGDPRYPVVVCARLDLPTAD